MTTDDERDAEGRHPGTPVWSGDLAAASSAALTDHVASLRRHIAALTAKYEAHQVAGQKWRAATATELDEARFGHWIARLVDTENELSRRERPR